MSKGETITEIGDAKLRTLVEHKSGQDVQACYQCGKCSAGCPAAYTMDLSPRQAMRAIQLGLEELVLNSDTIWICLQCQICSVRCPRLIDIAKVMETLRILSLARGIKPSMKEAKVFHRLFLDVIKQHGRMYEFQLASSYNLLSGHLFNNLAVLPAILRRGKMPFRPPHVEGIAEIKEIFHRAEALEKEPR